MKYNFIKYIFVFFVVGIIICAIYVLYFKNKTYENDNLKNETIEQIEQITDLRLSISNFDTINPIISNNKEVLNVSKLIFEPLISLSEDYKIQFNLASECSKTSDTTYIIKINDKIKWQDGTKLKSSDIAYTIETIKLENSVYSYNVDKIKSIDVIDENTIKINLSQPVPFFEYNLTFPILQSNYNDNNILIGTGMYKILEITNSEIKLIKNEDWWNENNRPKIKNINIKIANEIGEVYNSFKMGNIDIFNTSNKNLQDYIGTIGYEKKEIRGREFDYLAFNCENKILKNKEIRKAICLAIDKVGIVNNVFKDEYYVSNYPLDYGSYLYEEDYYNINYDKDNAKKIIDNGSNISLILTVNNSNSNRLNVAQNIKKQLSDIGINIIINNVSDSRYNQILKNKDYEMILTGIYNSFSPDLSGFFGEDNLQKYKQEEILTILKEIQNIENENILKEKYKRILEIYNEDIPFIGLYRNKNLVVKKQNLIGEIKANNYFTFYEFYNWYRI